MTDEYTDDQTRESVLAIIGAYLLWIVTMVLAFGVCISWQTVLLRAYAALGWNRYGSAGFNYAVIIVLITIWLALTVVTEHWYRRAARQGHLLRRAVQIIGILLALTGVALAANRLG